VGAARGVQSAAARRAQHAAQRGAARRPSAPRSRAAPRTRLEAPLGHQLFVLLLVHYVEHGVLLLDLVGAGALGTRAVARGLQLLQHARQLGGAALHITPRSLHPGSRRSGGLACAWLARLSPPRSRAGAEVGGLLKVGGWIFLPHMVCTRAGAVAFSKGPGCG
jgi:hypothetical protein